ncbi:hypothetical protein U6B65_08395 [Oscillospiraceae bacterium MB08-C2-2]|nr:hypothetical protein U6B65_08395 [Oscillospiraceae bacterium MB08-C2-2]
MELRNELQPPIRKKVNKKQLEQLIMTVEDAYEFNQDYAEFLLQINELLPPSKSITLSEIRSYSGVCSLDEFIDDILTISPKLIKDITKEELFHIINFIMEDPCNKDIHYYINLLEKNFPNGNTWDLIFNPDVLGYDLKNSPSAKEIAELVFSSQPR